jgi:hypothetical protein
MSPLPNHTRRRVLTLLAGGIVLGASPFGLGCGSGPFLAPSAAWARDGEDDSDGDDDDGGQGRGRGRGRGGDDDDHDDLDDRDDDGSGPGRGGNDDEEIRSRPGDGGDSDTSIVTSSSGGRAPSPQYITVLYPDGWTERIVSGRYELVDPQSRLVANRAATGDDFARMIALR